MKSLKPKDILAQYGIRPDKALGQNFLIDKHVMKRFLQAADLAPNDVVLEIGSGIGAITLELARQVKQVIAVEKDKGIANVLQEVLRDANLEDKVQIVNEDILEFLISNNKCMPRTEWYWGHILGAIPYSITSPLLHKLIKEAGPLVPVTLIIQNEVANKIAAKSPNATYLSNFVQTFYNVSLVGKPISPPAFWPQPKVYSRIIKLMPKSSIVISKAEDINKFEKFLHQGFSNPRKMLNKVFDKERLLKAEIDPQSRPQRLSLEQWLKLFSTL